MGTVSRVTACAAVLLGCSGIQDRLCAQGAGIGFEPVAIPQGYSLLSNPFSSGANRIEDLFGDAPDGFELAKLIGGAWQTNRYDGSLEAWSLPGWTLTPGEGALAISPSAFTWYAVGRPSVGSLLNVVPEGRSLRSSILPLVGRLSSDLGFPGQEGLALWGVDPSEGTFSVVASFEGGAWNPEDPVWSPATAYMVQSPQALLWETDYPVEGESNPLRFTAQPEDQFLEEGEELRLSAGVSGASPVDYQWRKDGSDIPGATGSSWGIPSASLADSGLYSVVAHADGYTLHSRAAQVSVSQGVVSGEASLALEMVETGLRVVLAGEPGARYRLETSETVAGGEWTAVAEELILSEEGRAVQELGTPDKASAFFRALPL